MTNRFKLGDYSNNLQEIWFDEDYIIVRQDDAERLCDLLNNLNNENKQLTYELEICRNSKLFSRRQLEKENEQLKQFQNTVFVLINEMIETANHYRTPIKSLNYGDDLGYWNGVYQKLKELREILEKEKGDMND